MTIQRRTTRTATPKVMVVAAALALASCGGDDAASDPATTVPATTLPATTTPDTTVPATTVPATTAPDTTVPATTAPDTTQPETTMPAEQPPVVETAIADLAERTTRSASEISVARYESVTWSDGSIGCPEPGMSYTQALVPGYRIELVADGVSYWYHGARDGQPFWCADPSDPVAGEAGDR